MTDFLLELIVSLLLLVGSFFLLVGSFGLVKLPSFMQRLHAPTKASTLGIGSILLASMVYFIGLRGEFTFHELLITLFIFVSAPITAHVLAKAHLHCDRFEAARLPPTGRAAGWATFDDPRTPDDESKRPA